ncbi:hypothetical protein GPJ61_16305 [Brevibacillus formosus]|uniref:hypothetical protein n=1 Tax=Brevibacillus formosus TaxID=54913 RepID=UPI001CA49B0C|nr:hypothetical protein [Brevibacillus formosus]MBW5469423.1 hypothetical protein [Brevibacillus formosus]
MSIKINDSIGMGFKLPEHVAALNQPSYYAHLLLNHDRYNPEYHVQTVCIAQLAILPLSNLLDGMKMRDHVQSIPRVRVLLTPLYCKSISIYAPLRLKLLTSC